MNLPIFTQVDDYIRELFQLDNVILDETIESIRRVGLPEHSVSALQGLFLMQLVLMSKASHIIEVGTLGGYSTIWLARGLGPTGKLITIEIDPLAADIAQQNIKRAGLESKVSVIVGNALEILEQLNDWPVDFLFMDADKPGYIDYFNWAVKRMSKGSLIVADNVIREGKLLDPHSTDEKVVGVRRYLEMLAKDTSTLSSVHQQIGPKGHDGLAISLIL